MARAVTNLLPRAVLCALLCGMTQLVASQPGAREGSPVVDRSTWPRSIVLERRLEDTEGWTFYHSVRELPEDLRALLFRVADRHVVDPGESFNVSDVKVLPSSSQHLFTAATKDTGVIVWYSGGFGGLGLHVVVYDRLEHDACRYDFFRAPSGVMLISLAGMVRDKDPRRFRWQYFGPDQL